MNDGLIAPRSMKHWLDAHLYHSAMRSGASLLAVQSTYDFIDGEFDFCKLRNALDVDDAERVGSFVTRTAPTAASASSPRT